MLWPRRVKRPKMGVRIQIDKIFMRHRKWVKGFGCSVPGCKCTDIEFAHIRNAANSGKGNKPHDSFGRPLCGALHHVEEHKIGADSFDRKHAIDRYAQAAWFLRNTPDRALRDSFAELPDHVKRPLLEAT